MICSHLHDMWKLFVQCADNMHKNNGTIENIYRSMHFAQLSQSAAVKYELAEASELLPKGQLSSAIRAMIVRCEKAGVDIRLNTEADADTLKELHADAIILATGSTPLILPIPGLNESGYVTAQDMLLGKAEVGKKALVVGGGMVGCEAAKAI